MAYSLVDDPISENHLTLSIQYFNELLFICYDNANFISLEFLAAANIKPYLPNIQSLFLYFFIIF